MELRNLPTQELGPLPWSLAASDGSLVKSNKAVLPKLLEDGVECLPSLPDQTTAVIIDAMALLQTLARVPNRFSELAEMVMTRILVEAGEASRIDFVGEHYPAISIKNTEKKQARQRWPARGQYHQFRTVLPTSVEKVHAEWK